MRECLILWQVRCLWEGRTRFIVAMQARRGGNVVHFIHSFTTPTLLIPFGPHVCFSLTSHVSSNSFFTALFFFVTFCMSLSYPCSFYTHLSFCSSKSSPLLFVSLQPSLFLCDSNSFFQNHFLCDSDSVLNTTFFLSLFPSTLIYLFVLLILLPFSLSLRLYR